MSRVGKLEISVPSSVKVQIKDDEIKVDGPKGTLVKRFNKLVNIQYSENAIKVTPSDESKEARAMWGTARSIINSMVKGVNQGYSEELEVNGVGYRAAVKGSYLNLTLGKSHNTKIEIPTYISVDTPKQNSIILKSIDKEKLGHFIANIIKQRPPEPYKGKGIKRKDQYVQRKEGKKN